MYETYSYACFTNNSEKKSFFFGNWFVLYCERIGVTVIQNMSLYRMQERLTLFINRVVKKQS